MIGWILLFLICLLSIVFILALVRWNPVLIWRIQPMWVWDYVYFAIAMTVVSNVSSMVTFAAWNWSAPSPRVEGLEFVFRNAYVVFGLAYWVWSMRLIKPGD